MAQAEDILPKVEDELYAFGKALEQHTDLRESLTRRGAARREQESIVEDLLGERAHPITLGLLRS